MIDKIPGPHDPPDPELFDTKQVIADLRSKLEAVEKERDEARKATKCTLEENINRAAAELPEGWIIEINVEAGAGWVTLYDGCGNSVDVAGEKRTINEQVSEAISYAREHSYNEPEGK